MVDSITQQLNCPMVLETIHCYQIYHSVASFIAYAHNDLGVCDEVLGQKQVGTLIYHTVASFIAHAQ